MPTNLLRTPVLVLNASYEPIHVCAARRALVLLFKGLAHAEEQSHHKLRSPSAAMPLPTVIRLIEYRRIPQQSRALSRKNILMRDHYTCQYCGNAGRRQRPDARPRAAALPRRLELLGKPRRRLPPLQ